MTHQECLHDSAKMVEHNHFKKEVHSRRFGQRVSPLGMMSSFSLSALITLEPIPQTHSAEKLAFYNPLTTMEHMRIFLDHLIDTITKVRSEY